MLAKALDLFQAYFEEKLPNEGGYILSSFFDVSSTYSRYEVVGYNGGRSVEVIDEGLFFHGDGNKLYVLVEPPGYPGNREEPLDRPAGQRIPLRFCDLEIHVTENQTRVMVSKKPLTSHNSFTIVKPTGVNFALIFYRLPDALESIGSFLTQTLNKEAAVPQADSRKAADSVVQGLKKLTVW